MANASSIPQDHDSSNISNDFAQQTLDLQMMMQQEPAVQRMQQEIANRRSLAPQMMMQQEELAPQMQQELD